MTLDDTTVAQDIKELTAPEARKLIEKRRNDSNFVILDVRTPEEFVAGHIEDALLVDFTAPDFEYNIQTLPRNKTYLVYCRSGNRSSKAARLMRENGFSSLLNLKDGITDWQKQGLPVEKTVEGKE